MKIIIYSKTEVGKQALKNEFKDLARMTEKERSEFNKLFTLTYDERLGMVALVGSPMVDMVNPFVIRAKIVSSLDLENAKENIDYRLVVE